MRNHGWLQGFAFATLLAVVDAAPALADRRAAIAYVAKQAPKSTDELPLPAVPTVDDVVALYKAVGTDLRKLAARDHDASIDLLPRFRMINVLHAARDSKRRRVIARELVVLRQLIAKHAN